jgi:hypothetical protein
MTSLRLQDQTAGNVIDEVRKLIKRVGDIEENMVSVSGLARREVLLSQREIGWLAQLLPLSFYGVTGFWNFASRGVSDLSDLSGQGRALTINGGATLSLEGLIGYMALDGSTQYLSRADEAGLDLSSFTIGLWVRFDDATAGATEALISKWQTIADQRSYELHRNVTGNAITLNVSTAGTSGTVTAHAGPAVSDTFWHFCWARHAASTSMTVGVDAQIVTTTSGVPAGAFAGTSPFDIGARTGPSAFLDGRVGPAFISRGQLSDDLMRTYYALSRLAFGDE